MQFQLWFTFHTLNLDNKYVDESEVKMTLHKCHNSFASSWIYSLENFLISFCNLYYFMTSVQLEAALFYHFEIKPLIVKLRVILIFLLNPFKLIWHDEVLYPTYSFKQYHAFNRTSNSALCTLHYFKYDITTHISDFKTNKYKHLTMYTMPYVQYIICAMDHSCYMNIIYAIQ